MNIKFTYRKSLDFSEQEKDFLENKSTSFGQVEIKTYSSRSGALDLVSIVETTLSFALLTNLQAFIKGFIGEDWFKELGVKARSELESELKQAKNFLKAFYDVFIKDKQKLQEAFVISETIGEVTLFVVINHCNMTDELLDKLPKALVDTYGKISLGHIEIESKICQLYPDFKNSEWRYLFAPTFSAFGNYVDQYYDFKFNKMVQINSKEEFIEKFELIEEDKYKLIINALIER